jgi:nucleotide-binding universal stress UspA family protein
MNKSILLGVDINFSSPTQSALSAVSELLEQFSPHLRLVLLTVIPVLSDTSPSQGKSRGRLTPLPATAEERLRAEQTLRQARKALQQRGIALERIDIRIRTGGPAEELAKTAKELDVHFIVIGSRGESWKDTLRRLFTGSISRRVLRLAPCPIMIVTPAHKSIGVISRHKVKGEVWHSDD